MMKIEELLNRDYETIAVAGHVSPDGDCMGSTTAMVQYLKKIFPKAQVDLYLEQPKPAFLFLKEAKEAMNEVPDEKKNMVYDLFVTCDVSDPARIAVAGELFAGAKQRVCFDHHISNNGFADVNHIVPDASSACEVLYDVFSKDVIDRDIAISLYTGLVTDSGCFQFSNTSPHTMRVGADLLEYGFRHNEIVDNVFHKRTFLENKITGYALQKAESRLNGRIITTCISNEEMERFGVEKKNLDLIVGQLRLTEGAEGAIFLYQMKSGEYKASLRSNGELDVAEVAAVFGGGGHVKAAGCTLQGDPKEELEKLLHVVEGFLDQKA